MSEVKENGEMFPVFPYMNHISFLTYEQFTDAVSEARAQMLDVNKELINARGKEEGILDWESREDVPTGRFHTIYRGICLECFLEIKPGRPLYVMLNGANSSKETRFSRWSYFSFCSGSILCLADPMLKMYDALSLGWYYGKDELNLRKVIADFVRELAHKIGVYDENIIFVGSSGGGAATFECASYISGAKAVAINPQIVLAEYYYAEEFSAITGNDLQNDLYGHRNNALYYIKNHGHNPFIIISNLRSGKDMEQIKNVRDMLHIDVQYGLNIYDNLIIWLYDAEVAPVLNPHEAQEYYCIWFFIEYLVNHMDRICSRKGDDLLDSVYKLVNEFWHDHWLMKRAQKEKSRNWTMMLRRVIGSGREVVLFGSGIMAERMLNEILDVHNSNFLQVRYIIDNDAHKAGQELYGCGIMHPSEISDWSHLYILIATERYGLEVCEQLEHLGLIYQEDFMYGTDII